MAYDFIWPISKLHPLDGKPKIRAATIGGGASMSGLEQVTQSDRGFWTCTYAKIPIRTLEQVRLWNILEGLAKGRAARILIPFNDCGNSPWPLDGEGKPITSWGLVPFSDDTIFNDGSSFYTPIIDAEVVTSTWPIGASTIALRINYGGVLLAGMHFSVGHRGYRILRITTATAGGGGVVTYTGVQIWPPLREAIALGAVINFDKPWFKGRLASDGEMDVDFYLGKFADPTVNFVEDPY